MITKKVKSITIYYHCDYLDPGFTDVYNIMKCAVYGILVLLFIGVLLKAAPCAPTYVIRAVPVSQAQAPLLQIKIINSGYSQLLLNKA